MTLNKAAQELGKLGKGIPKNYTKEERRRRSEWMKHLNDLRPQKSK